MLKRSWLFIVVCLLCVSPVPAVGSGNYEVTETDEQITIVTPQIEAAIAKRGYVSGVKRQSLLDKKTGFRDPGFGLDIVDFLLEPMSDAAYRDQLPPKLRYKTGDLYHGRIVKRFVEGPQICTRARQLSPKIIRGNDFVAIRQQYKYHDVVPGRQPGSVWTQILVFPVGKRYFLSMDRIDSVNASKALLLRIDMPGHIRHHRGDTFSRVYLSYHGTIPASEFFVDFPPDAKFLYQRKKGNVPERFIRAYQLRDPATGKSGPWLAGMTLAPSAVHEAWCHERGYVCMIEEIGGRPVKRGGSFQAAFVVGYFDSIAEMRAVYDQYKGHTGLEVTGSGWKLLK